jgi:hypothetical protein
MKRKILIVLSSAVAVLLASAPFILNRYPLQSKASEPIYKSIYERQSNNTSYKDLKCLATEDTSTIQEALILRDLKKISPKGVPYRDVLVAVKHVIHGEAIYTLHAVDYRKGECGSYYSTIGDEEESNPLSRVFSDQHALEIQLIWDKWRLENIPSWKSRMQKYLNRPNVQLAKEEFMSLKQLGFKMPKKWKEIK